jgi:hypothetical protein
MAFYGRYLYGTVLLGVPVGAEIRSGMNESIIACSGGSDINNTPLLRVGFVRMLPSKQASEAAGM